MREEEGGKGRERERERLTLEKIVFDKVVKKIFLARLGGTDL